MESPLKNQHALNHLFPFLSIPQFFARAMIKVFECPTVLLASYEGTLDPSKTKASIVFVKEFCSSSAAKWLFL
jgi:hypothetical protein